MVDRVVMNVSDVVASASPGTGTVHGMVLLVMHRYHFLLTDPIPIYFVLKLADTWPMPILCHRGIIYIKPPIFTAVNN